MKASKEDAVNSDIEVENVTVAHALQLRIISFYSTSITIDTLRMLVANPTI
jgi:hypothetical protein